MNRESNLQRTGSTSHIGTAEMSLAMWLRNGRAQKNYSLDDVARITKIQSRILERLEAGRLDGLPAEVFVRGFVRSFARCVGLDEDEALRRYTACVKDGGSKVPPAVAARAVIDAMGDLAPNARSLSKTHEVPQILRDEPLLASGSLEMPESVVDDAPETSGIEGMPSLEELPVEISFSEVVAAPVETSTPVEAIEAIDTTNDISDGAVVVAPPADMDLSAEIALPTTPAKKKRTRRAATVDGSLPATAKRTRRKVATGTPVEPTPVVAETSEAVEAAPAEAAPKRRRKPRGSVQPPVIEAAPAVEIPVEVVAEQAPVSDVVAIEGSSDVVETVAVEQVAAMSAIDTSSAADELFAPASSAIVDSSTVTEVEGAFEGKSAIAPSGIDVVDHQEDNSTAKFERLDDDEAPVQLPTEAWTPRMPPFAMPSQPSWRKSPAQPALVAVIDDADPDGAERALEDRRAGERRRTFLPPILLDRDGDRSGRQGGLTLAVIILLIAATLTLSYLMRRPSASGDGVTSREAPTQVDRLIG
jgi:hypothetical protein